MGKTHLLKNLGIPNSEGRREGVVLPKFVLPPYGRGTEM